MSPNQSFDKLGATYFEFGKMTGSKITMHSYMSPTIFKTFGWFRQILDLRVQKLATMFGPRFEKLALNYIWMIAKCQKKAEKDLANQK